MVSYPRILKQENVLKRMTITMNIIYNILEFVFESQSEHSSDPEFPKARALKYNAERGQAYLLCSEWVQELPCRYGRYTLTLMKGMSQGPDSNRNGIALQAIAQPLRHLGNQRRPNDEITYKTFHLDHVLSVHISDIVWNQQGRQARVVSSRGLNISLP